MFVIEIFELPVLLQFICVIQTYIARRRSGLNTAQILSQCSYWSSFDAPNRFIRNNIRNNDCQIYSHCQGTSELQIPDGCLNPNNLFNSAIRLLWVNKRPNVPVGVYPSSQNAFRHYSFTAVLVPVLKSSFITPKHALSHETSTCFLPSSPICFEFVFIHNAS